MISSCIKRFIPAGAGNTWTPVIASFSTAVYPRWRGEHLFTMNCEIQANGLSPLARGTREQGAECIPQATVYPRWRGEHAVLVIRN